MITKIDVENINMDEEIINHNLQKISLINIIYTIIILLFFVITHLNTKLEQSLILSDLIYVILFLFNITCFYLLDVKKFHLKLQNKSRIKLFINSYVLFFLLSAVVISVRNQDIYNALLIYTLILFTFSSFLILRGKELLFPFLLSSSSLIVGLYLQYGNSENFHFQLIYIVTIIPIAFIISRSFYKSFEKNFNKQLELLNETKKSRNITEILKEVNAQLEKAASIDPLTNVSNRRALNEYINILQINSLESPFILSAIMIDLDCFKLYNDTYGHAEGDNVLIQIGKVLKGIAEENECFATRWGGEEFTLLLVDRPQKKIELLCKQIQDEVRNLNIHHGTSTIDNIVTVSIGACTKTITEPNDIYACVDEADFALYFVKEHGRNSFEHRWIPV